MSDPTPPELRRLRSQLIGALSCVAVCVIVALGAVVSWLSFHIAWMAGLFVAATVAGFAVQIWLMIAFARARPPQ